MDNDLFAFFLKDGSSSDVEYATWETIELQSEIAVARAEIEGRHLAFRPFLQNRLDKTLKHLKLRNAPTKLYRDIFYTFTPLSSSRPSFPTHHPSFAT
ncbi:hypothetical protein N7481_002301 [Penicillium waksmanii]|uniref:uncharacterized protein n=1 Tax=Penicillium waksmanii TaxID=69791 RepID=UPI002547C61B|nr:uncharacterized protein N7481_002301 [Penicillium waksmanii]KAJ5995324.1 hypothetical protein N7481_002301 [Penicillium waksmanii]